MHGRHQRKAPKLLLVRGFLALILVLVLCFTSFATVMANTVSINVIDGDSSYSFSMNSTDIQDILAQAQGQGLPALGELDVAEWVESTTTVIVRRGTTMRVQEAGKELSFTAYIGDTVGKTLQDNSILLKKADVVDPQADTVITGSLVATISRNCTVTVTADGKTKSISLTGKTVGDAIRAAGVTLGQGDSANYEDSEALFDKMNIRVSRSTKIKVTVDGETKEYAVSASNVEAALQKLGVEYSQDDKLNVSLKDKITDGMEIEISRRTSEEVTETQELEYETVYEDTDSLYEGETQVKTPGANGVKEILYKVLYLDGAEEERTVLEEKVTKEPVKEVVLRGTKVKETESGQDSSAGDSQGGASGGIGTFVDMYGNTVSYSNVLTGDCTAYSVPGGTTSLGWPAEYGVIAVNPNIIPYGTKMYVTSPDGSVVYGYGVAGDTGGACMEGIVIADLCYNTIEECSIIGRRTMNVYILS